jgi:hypothetical protein
VFWARRTLIVFAGSVVMVFVGGSSSLSATGISPALVDDGQAAIHGDAWIQARAAALAASPGGRVTDSEAADEDSFYEVEVTLGNGEQVDVHLDTAFRVVSTSNDSERHDGRVDE